MLGGILLAKILAFIVKPALLLSIVKKLKKSVKKPPTPTPTVEGRMLEEDVPLWAHAIISAIDSFADTLSEDSLKSVKPTEKT